MPELVVALDFPARDQALAMARRLAGTVGWVKVGLELYTAQGPGVVAELKAMGFKVFVDLKFLDIPNTVRGAVKSAVAAGADMLNVHATGGRRMLAAARQGLVEAAGDESPRPLLLGVTVLTSMDASDLSLAPGQSVADLALGLARACHGAGLDGVVCSGHEAAAIKAACGTEFLCLAPGIRLAGTDDDQRRVMTPARAAAAGADFLVAGRPVTQAEDPLAAAKEIIAQLGPRAV